MVETSKLWLYNGYYYSKATPAVEAFLDIFKTTVAPTRIAPYYDDAKEKLTLCEGYKNSDSLLLIIEKLYSLWATFPYESGVKGTLDYMDASYSGNIIFIQKDEFIQSLGGSLSLALDIESNTFTADITRVYNSIREYNGRKVIVAMLGLFTDVAETADFESAFMDNNNWTKSGKVMNFSMSYGGYFITIQITPNGDNHTDCTISVIK